MLAPLGPSPARTHAGAQDLNRNVLLPGGYAIRTAVTGLNFPTGMTFGQGAIFVSEAGGIAGTAPRIVRVNEDGSIAPVASGSGLAATSAS